jgi:geranylgeranyl transferase type-2 subunit alpha
MHGRNRSEFKAKRGSAIVATKALQLRTLEEEVLKRRKANLAPIVPDDRDLSVDLALSRNYLLLNPDPLWIWNFRRDLLVKIGVDASTEKDCLAPAFVEVELDLTAACLRSNPKSYGAWLHRKWLSFKHSGREAFWLGELELTGLLLSNDERNFHCWNYRRHIVRLLLGPETARSDQAVDELSSGQALPLFDPQVSCSVPTTVLSSTLEPRKTVLGEWDFSTLKVNDNFSNFSAFHYRSSLVCDYTRALLDYDWEMVESAVFTDPFE